jgi:hypothetical protein
MVVSTDFSLNKEECWNFLEAPEGGMSLLSDYISTITYDYVSIPDVFLDFEKIIPVPDLCRAVGSSWTLENWGVSTNAWNGYANDIGISFYTYERPPSKVIAELAKLIKKPLHLFYDRYDEDICGELVIDSEGNCIDNDYSPRTEVIKKAPHIDKLLFITERNK